jgi:oxygen-independent coproporphyrinogen-3 oxidase
VQAQPFNLRLDPQLLRRYDRPGPRYTSYPTAAEFHPGFGPASYAEAVQHSATMTRALSLYFHLPFCAHVCYYCACTKIITANRARSVPYVAHLLREIEMQARLLDQAGQRRTVQQLHWGGGTPTFLSDGEMRALMAATRYWFQLRDDDQGEYGIEVDPRELRPNTLSLLRELGFNRLSVGIQDLDPEVQLAVNRIQPFEMNRKTVETARQLGFRSISVDLIYGLPRQNTTTFAQTLDGVIALAPDRLSVFSYAHLPARFKPQRQINADELPKPGEKIKLLSLAIEKLTAAGYVYIGMDHFARPDDDLTIAQQSGTLTRNFQGYSTNGDCDLIGMGLSAISYVGDSYAQNEKSLPAWQAAIEAGHLPIARGITMNNDDRLRHDIIMQLICHFSLKVRAVERSYGIRFDDYFADEMDDLRIMEKDGLLAFADGVLCILPAGRLLVRNICMVFDRYRRKSAETVFSRTV